VFSSLGDRVAGARFADLFAGTGSYGLEAWSRGAAGGVFIERHRPTAGLLRRNLEAVARSGKMDTSRVRVEAADVLGGWEASGDAGAFDLVFIDPPYADIPALWTGLFSLCDRLLKGTDLARVMFELPADLHPAPAAGWEETRRLDGGGGQPTASFWRRVPPG
jgi:16S rRNA (guanine966-N2)-methyltransferase